MYCTSVPVSRRLFLHDLHVPMCWNTLALAFLAKDKTTICVKYLGSHVACAVTLLCVSSTTSTTSRGVCRAQQCLVQCLALTSEMPVLSPSQCAWMVCRSWSWCDLNFTSRPLFSQLLSLKIGWDYAQNTLDWETASVSSMLVDTTEVHEERAVQVDAMDICAYRQPL
jgi:hypothetical protein